jgi:2-phospho-L-lactate guanylyltransferase
MSIWAIVPVKPFSQAKSRLQDVLSPEDRAALGRQFLLHTLDVLGQVREIDQVLVISRDSTAMALAQERQARAVAESGASDLNGALRRATETALSQGAHGVAVLPTDLPYLSAEVVRGLVSEPGAGPAVVIAPDRQARGTNALFVRPPGLIPYAFGPNSFRIHRAAAQRSGARVRIYRSVETELDVDVPEDWELYQTRRFEVPSFTHP